MILEKLTNAEYGLLCKEAHYFYNTAQFHALNENKVDNVEYLLFKERKNKLALAAGIHEGELRVPYSAPFGVFEQLQKHIKIEEIEEALSLLEAYAKEKNICKLMFRLPSAFYDETFLSKLQNCMLRMQYNIEYCDLNYALHITNMEFYEKSLFRNARKNLTNAKKESFAFQVCQNDYEWEQAYQVIKENRQRRGFPLRMTFEQVMQTKACTKAEAFILKLDDVAVAAAIVFQVTKTIAQVIYWGDIGGYEQKRPMNLLAYRLYEYYSRQKIEVLDIGPSTEAGIPNLGLCDYKESVGCGVSTKYTLVKNIK